MLAVSSNISIRQGQIETVLAEERRWCEARALDHLDPLVYAAFLDLDPLNMDDIERTIWRDRLQGSGFCSMYSKEPFSDANAHKRNRQYETACFSALTQAVDVRWEYLVEPAVRYHKTAAYDIPNQYVRILRWIHLTGEELLEMDAPPVRATTTAARQRICEQPQYPHRC